MSSSEMMQCMEVWGGNQSCDRSLQTPGLDLWIYNRPYDDAESGGDVYYVSSCASGRITRLLVADVSGHGTEVSNIANRLRQLMRKYINVISQKRFVGAMNAEFSDQTEGMFATAVALTFFAPTRRLGVSNAGHPAPFLRKAGKSEWKLVNDSQAKASDPALPLGIVDSTIYGQSDIRFEAGDCLLLHTDSLSEAHDADGKILGTAGLLERLNRIPIEQPAETLISKLLDSLSAENSDNLEDDDVTVVLARANGKNVPLANSLLAPIRMFTALFSRS